MYIVHQKIEQSDCKSWINIGLKPNSLCKKKQFLLNTEGLVLDETGNILENERIQIGLLEIE